MNPRDVPRIIATHDPAALVVSPEEPGLPALIDRVELAWVIAYDSAGKVRRCQRVAQGGHSSVHVPLPVALSVPLLAHCDRFVLVHSHPAGLLLVNEQDRQLTREVLAAAQTCGLTLMDHVIITPSSLVLSMVETRHLAPVAPGLSKAAGNA